MVLDKLGSSLKESLKKITKSVFVDERLIDELVRDIQRALLAADVNVQLVFDLSKKIKERALAEKDIKGISPKEHLVKIVYEELTNFMGGEKSEIAFGKKKPFKIMMVGLFGSGKTTCIGKLAKYYASRGKKVAAIGLDVWRPAAMEQLENNCEKAGVKCFIKKGEKNPFKIWEEFEAKLSSYDLVLVDTAGRDALNDELIEEIENVNKMIKPDEVFLVISADIGQTAQKQAEQFHKSCGVTGVIITKMDGSAKGGGALAATSITKAPIKFIGVGEKVDDLESFNPKGFVGRLLGMGDIEALLEKAELAIDKEKAEDMGKKFLKGDFNFLDLYEQMAAMKKMGSLSKLLDMIPGFGGAQIPKEMLDVQEGKLEKWKYILQSFTKKELENPEIITGSRIDRAAKGSGVKTSEVRELLKQYRMSKKMMKAMKGMGDNLDMNKMMRKFKGKKVF